MIAELALRGVALAVNLMPAVVAFYAIYRFRDHVRRHEALAREIAQTVFTRASLPRRQALETAE